MKKERIKVVWLCHLRNAELNTFFNMQKSGSAPWMTSFIDMARAIPELELHIVAPNQYTNKDIAFDIKGTSFHLFKYCSGVLSYRNTPIELAIRGGKNIEKKVKAIVDDLNPDLVHLFGAENPDYSEGILPLFDSFPTLITYQGFVCWAPPPKNPIKRFVHQFRVKREMDIYNSSKNVTFFSCEDYVRREFVKMYPGKNILRLDYPQQIPQYDATQFEKRYDLVFWGRVTKNKGIEDVIHAVAFLKERKSDFKAIIMGDASTQYMEVLKNLVSELGVEENIQFLGFQPTFDEVFRKAAAAKVYTLPTYFDAVPGSITEAMFLKLPVVTYPVGGIPFLNDKRECVVLAETNNVLSLAESIWTLCEDKGRRDTLIKNAYERVCELCNNSAISSQMINNYKQIMGA